MVEADSSKTSSFCGSKEESLSGALSIKSFKKKLFLSLVKFLGLYKNITWHASTEMEAGAIKKVFGKNIKIKIALDVPNFNKNQVSEYRLKEEGKLKILSISSIVKIKNLKFVFETLNKVKGEFTLDIYGPIKDKSYWNKCLKAISPNIKDRVVYKGEIHYNDIYKVYPNYDLFFFPTLSESFGHVIWKAWFLAVPF